MANTNVNNMNDKKMNRDSINRDSGKYGSTQTGTSRKEELGRSGSEQRSSVNKNASEEIRQSNHRF